MTAQFESRFDVAYDGELPDTVDTAALRRIDAVAYALDESVAIPGTSVTVGIDPILGILPVAGDVASAGLSLYIVAEAAALGVSSRTLLRMVGNIAIDVAGGLIPYVGTLFDSFWKANRRNMRCVLADLGEPRPSR